LRHTSISYLAAEKCGLSLDRRERPP